MLRLRDKLLPLVQLKTLLKIGAPGDAAENGFIVVIQVGSQTFGIVVDGVFHTEEIVVKPMSSKLRHIPMFSGNTILGDGSVIMIIDPNGIAHTIGSAALGAAGGRRRTRGRAQRRTTPRPNRCWCSAPARRSQGGAAVARHPARRDRRQDDRNLRTAGPWCSIAASSCRWCRSKRDVRIKQRGAQPLLVFSDGGRSMGLVVDEIVDIVEERLDIEVASERPGVLGSAVIKGQATEIIDVGHFLPLAFEDWLPARTRPARRPRAGAAAGRRCAVLPQHAEPRCSRPPAMPSPASARRRMRWRCCKAGGASTCVVTDIEMPGMSGFELASAVRGDPRTADDADHRPVVDRCRRMRSSAGARSACTTTSPSSIARA